MCRTVGAKFSAAFRTENQYRTGQPFTYIFCNASCTKHVTATPDLRDVNALSISSGRGTQSLAGMDPKRPPQRRRNLVAHMRTLLCDVVPGGACPAAALVAVRRASNARVEGATPLSMFWSSAQQRDSTPRPSAAPCASRARLKVAAREEQSLITQHSSDSPLVLVVLTSRTDDNVRSPCVTVTEKAITNPFSPTPCVL